ncbi:ribonuclease H-like domain-containing protein [Tanacetum coccineum]
MRWSMYTPYCGKSYYQLHIDDRALSETLKNKQWMRKGMGREISHIVEKPSSSTPNPVRIIPGPAGLVQRAKMLKKNISIYSLISGWGFNGNLRQVVAIVKSCSSNALGDLKGDSEEESIGEKAELALTWRCPLRSPLHSGAANTVVETYWLCNHLRELHTLLLSATIVYCDKVSVVYLSSNRMQHKCTKHTEIDIHFVCDLVAIGHDHVLHVPS